MVNGGSLKINVISVLLERGVSRVGQLRAVKATRVDSVAWQWLMVDAMAHVIDEKMRVLSFVEGNGVWRSHSLFALL